VQPYFNKYYRPLSDFSLPFLDYESLNLGKINEQYFDVILTDIKMPVMNGMDFYTQAVAKDKDIGKRFVLFSGIVDEQILSFVKRNRLAYLVKPLPIGEIRLTVKKILEEASGN
jgi:YesN/AraC family two-component response regulator